MKILGIINILFGLVFAYWETKYFGYNFFPDSQEEFVCDIACLLLVTSGNILLLNKSKILNDCSVPQPKNEVCINCGNPQLTKTYDGYWCKWCKTEMDKPHSAEV